MDPMTVFAAIFVFALFIVLIGIFMSGAGGGGSDLSVIEGRADVLENKTANIETNVSQIATTSNNTLAFLRKMNETIDVIVNNENKLIVPNDVILSGIAVEDSRQQGGSRGVGREYAF